MQSYKNKHQGERCFILGNGPSLADIDLSLLENEITFGTNRIYLSGFTPTYYACVNELVLQQFWPEIMELDSWKFLSAKKKIGEAVDAPLSNLTFLDTSLREPMFSSPEGPIWEGHTVTYVCLQLAYYMGFSEVILLGVDHDYGEQRVPNMEVVATGPDANHFHPDYFSGGTRWHTPDLSMSEVAYSLAKNFYEKHGRKIINASAHTRLDVFEKLPLSYVLSEKAPRVSAIVSAYHADRYIDGLLDDLLSQTEDCQIVVVCEKESEEEEITGDVMGRVYPGKILMVPTEDIPTVYAAWNLGIKAASGKYITNANTDDRHHPRAYEIMADVLDARHDLDLVYHDSYISWTANQTFEEFIRENADKKLQPGRFENEPGIFSWMDYERGALARGCFIGPQPMWRASLHQEYGYFLANYKSAGDYEFWLRVAQDKNMFRIGIPLGVYHAHLDGVELSDPVTSAEEAHGAIQLHQSTKVAVTPSGNGTICFAIDGNYSFVNAAELLGVLSKEQA